MKVGKILRNENVGFYFTALITTAGLFVALALALDLFEIHIYRHDSVYYVDSYVDKLQSEGRWLYYLLFSVTSHIPGRVAVFSNLLFLFLFVFWVAKRWTGMAPYSFLLSLLIIQATPLMESLMWPATGITSFPTLFLAAIISPYINIYFFYTVFGVLLFGSTSFYLLPLAHLPLLKKNRIGQNVAILSFKIMPAWALGFIIGFIFSLFMIYALTGQNGIQIGEWRLPNYIRTLQDLIANTINSVGYLQYSLAELFSGFWRNCFMLTALLVGCYKVEKNEYVPAAILALGIIAVHFILIIPSGIVVSFRTSLAAWIGVLVIFFFYPNIKVRQYYLLLPIILFMIISFYRINHESLRYYSSITNTYYDELMRITPLPPRLYKGVLFVSSSADVKEMDAFLTRKFKLKPEKREPINEDSRWAPVAQEAGFKEVRLCKSSHKESAECKSLDEDYELHNSAKLNQAGLYKVHGQYNGFLVVSLNNDLDLLND